MRFYKTVIMMEVLSDSDGPSVPDMELIDLAEQVVHGDMSAKWDVTQHYEINREQFIKECELQGTYPGFFLGDDYEDEEDDD